MPFFTSSLLIFTTLILSSFYIFGIINNFKKAQNPCFQKTSEIQSEIKHLTQKLIRLNPKATSLRTEYRIAKEAVKNARDPYSAAAAATYMTSVLQRQSLLKAKQQSLIRKAVSISSKKLLSLKRRIYFKGPKKVKMQVYSKPKNTLTPNFYLIYKLPSKTKTTFKSQ